MTDPICWRSECRTGCYYPGVCSERPRGQCHPAYHDLGTHAPTQTSLTVGQRPSERASGETAVRDTDADPDALPTRPVRQAADATGGPSAATHGPALTIFEPLDLLGRIRLALLFGVVGLTALGSVVLLVLDT